MYLSSLSVSGVVTKGMAFLKKVKVYLFMLLLGIVLTFGSVMLVLTNQAGSIDRPLLIDSVRSVSELATSIHEVETIVPSFSERFFSVLKSRVLYIAHGEVRIGFDLSNMTDQDIQMDDDQGTLRITMPPLQILDTKIDLEKSLVYDSNKGPLSLGPSLIQLLEQSQRDSIEKINEAACQPWLIKNANILAAKSIENFLAQGILKNKSYEIDVKVTPLEEKMCTQNFEVSDI